MTHHQPIANELADTWQAPPVSDDAIAKILALAEASAQPMARSHISRPRFWLAGMAVAASLTTLVFVLPKFVTGSVVTDTVQRQSADNDMLNTIFATNEEEETLL